MGTLYSLMVPSYSLLDNKMMSTGSVWRGNTTDRQIILLFGARRSIIGFVYLFSLGDRTFLE